MTLHEEFKRVAHRFPDKLAINDGQKVYTYGEIYERSLTLSRSITHGAPAVSIVPNGFNDGTFYIWALAAMMAGKIAVVVRPDQSSNEIVRQSALVSVGQPHYADGAWMDFTSATTGFSKAVVHSHDRMVRLAEADALFLRLDPDLDRIAITRPGIPAYRYGFAGLLSGTPLIIKQPHEGLAEWIVGRGPTILSITATTFRYLMGTQHSFPSVRTLEVGGEMVDWDDLHLFRESRKFPCATFFNRYAMAETHRVSWLKVTDDMDGEGRLPVGYAAKDVEILIDPVNSEIVVHTPYLMIEYWNNPVLTQEKIHVDPHTGKRWYWTGDFGWFGKYGLNNEGRIVIDPVLLSKKVRAERLFGGGAHA